MARFPHGNVPVRVTVPELRITLLGAGPATGAALGWLLATVKVGDVVPVETYRNGAARAVQLILVEQPAGS